MEPVITKVVGPDETGVVAALAHEIWNQHFVPIAGQAQVDYMLAKFQTAPAIASQISSGYRYYAIMVDKEMAGYFALAPIPDGSTEAQLSKIYVREELQGRGLGRSMLAFAEELCAGIGVRKIWLTVFRHNVKTITFYENMGFTLTGEIVQDIGNGFVMDDFRMEKMLDPPGVDGIVAVLKELGDAETASHSQRFFKTGKGEYGEGDRFLGIRVPVLRKRARLFRETSPEVTLELLRSPWHEARLLALFMLVASYKKATAGEKLAIYRAYLGNTRFINNWDLVDSSAEHIVGAQLTDKDRKPLYRLARSKNLWERRIGIMSTFSFVKRGDFKDTLAISELLLRDREDLIHKAVGWMLREVGNRNRAVEKAFLADHYQVMPRTMLRYAIEKFPEEERKAYLKGTA